MVGVETMMVEDAPLTKRITDRRLEAGKKKFSEMMLNGGRRLTKAKRSRKPKPKSHTVETGTLIKYLSKYIVGGEDRAARGEKRKREMTDMELDMYDSNQKKFKDSVSLKQPDGGPNSKTETEPVCIQEDWNLSNDGSPMGIQRKFTL